MSYRIEQMRSVVTALQEQHKTWLDRVSISCSTEIAAEIMQHLQTVQSLRFEPFAKRCTPCHLLLKYVELLR